VRRDIDLMLAILVEAERYAADGYFSVEGFEKDAVDRHKELLCEAGYLQARYGNERKTLILLPRLTWKGLQTLGLLRVGWRRVKAGLAAAKIESPTFSLVEDLCRQALDGEGWFDEAVPDKKVVFASHGIDGRTRRIFEDGSSDEPQPAPSS
jgi:hypothetical protein